MSRYTNLAISSYGLTRFEVQGDVKVARRPWRRTVKVAVFDSLAQAEAFIRAAEAA